MITKTHAVRALQNLFIGSPIARNRGITELGTHPTPATKTPTRSYASFAKASNRGKIHHEGRVMRKRGGTSVDNIPRQRNDQLVATFLRNENTQRQS